MGVMLFHIEGTPDDLVCDLGFAFNENLLVHANNKYLICPFPDQCLLKD